MMLWILDQDGRKVDLIVHSNEDGTHLQFEERKNTVVIVSLDKIEAKELLRHLKYQIGGDR